MIGDGGAYEWKQLKCYLSNNFNEASFCKCKAESAAREHFYYKLPRYGISHIAHYQPTLFDYTFSFRLATEKTN